MARNKDDLSYEIFLGTVLGMVGGGIVAGISTVFYWIAKAIYPDAVNVVFLLVVIVTSIITYVVQFADPFIANYLAVGGLASVCIWSLFFGGEEMCAQLLICGGVGAIAGIVARVHKDRVRQRQDEYKGRRS